jgi:radical SAM protein with 4Fe4S-binding SPASM domain
VSRQGRYVRLADHASLRLLELPCLYDRRADELYELNEDGLEGLRRCHGGLTLAEARLEPEFADYCLAEGLLELWPEPRPRPLPLAQGPTPSLRYLELQVTWRCNLACGHCYLGPARGADLAVATAAAAAREFEALGGLRLMVSGGEPLMHPHWDRLNAALAALPVRRVLLTNGLLLTPERLAGLACDEVQVSLDGLEAGHQSLRGPGSFAPAVEAARRVREAGLELSIATMATTASLPELEGLARLVEELGAREWGIDAPVAVGRLAPGRGLELGPEQAAQAMSLAFGGAYHGGGEGMACGLHLATVAADGRVAQCGFYLDRALGSVEEGLWASWSRREAMPLSRVPACAACPAAADCGGGCRQRAPAEDQPDPVMCALHGVST